MQRLQLPQQTAPRSVHHQHHHLHPAAHQPALQQALQRSHQRLLWGCCLPRQQWEWELHRSQPLRMRRQTPLGVHAAIEQGAGAVGVAGSGVRRRPPQRRRQRLQQRRRSLHLSRHQRPMHSPCHECTRVTRSDGVSDSTKTVQQKTSVWRTGRQGRGQGRIRREGGRKRHTRDERFVLVSYRSDG
jgi:hypothetical protein